MKKNKMIDNGDDYDAEDDDDDDVMITLSTKWMHTGPIVDIQ